MTNPSDGAPISSAPTLSAPDTPTLALFVASLPLTCRRLVESFVFFVPPALVEAHRMLTPGVRFVGSIKVPGMEIEDAAAAPSQYDLTVLFTQPDVLGKAVIYVVHEAYEDRQACDMELTVSRCNEGDKTAVIVRVDFRDGETICSGVFDVGARRIAGNVRQLEYGEEGFEYPAEEVTHTFELCVVPESDALVQQRAALIAARRECSLAFGTWNVTEDDYKVLPQRRLRLAAWEAAFEAGVAESEISLAELRHRTRVLREVSLGARVCHALLFVFVLEPLALPFH